jgi:hypothetical protein
VQDEVADFSVYISLIHSFGPGAQSSRGWQLVVGLHSERCMVGGVDYKYIIHLVTNSKSKC